MGNQRSEHILGRRQINGRQVRLILIAEVVDAGANPLATHSGRTTATDKSTSSTSASSNSPANSAVDSAAESAAESPAESKAQPSKTPRDVALKTQNKSVQNDY